MQSEWEPAHCRALGRLLTSSLSYSGIAAALNAIFQTSYSRSAVIGRAKRMGLAIARPDCRSAPSAQARPFSLNHPGEYGASRPRLRVPIPEADPVELRRAEIDPRHLSLVDLQAGDCRYPYGGDRDGEAITFCGHPRLGQASYCAAHCELTRYVEPAPQAAPAGKRTRRPRQQDRSRRAGASPTSPEGTARCGNVVSLLNFKLQHRSE
jgi:GcrA cell cycle regulator